MVYDLRTPSRNFANVRRLSALSSVEEDVNKLTQLSFATALSFSKRAQFRLKVRFLTATQTPAKVQPEILLA